MPHLLRTFGKLNSTKLAIFSPNDGQLHKDVLWIPNHQCCGRNQAKTLFLIPE